MNGFVCLTWIPWSARASGAAPSSWRRRRSGSDSWFGEERKDKQGSDPTDPRLIWRIWFLLPCDSYTEANESYLVSSSWEQSHVWYLETWSYSKLGLPIPPAASVLTSEAVLASKRARFPIYKRFCEIVNNFPYRRPARGEPILILGILD